MSSAPFTPVFIVPKHLGGHHSDGRDRMAMRPCMPMRGMLFASAVQAACAAQLRDTCVPWPGWERTSKAAPSCVAR